MKLFNFPARVCSTVLIAMPMLLCAAGTRDALADANQMRWEGHEAVLDHAVAWQQSDSEGRWVTFVLLSDRSVPLSTLANTNALDPDVLSQDDQIAKQIMAQAVLFSVMTGGIPAPEGKTTQQGFYCWYHEGTRIGGGGKMSGTGGIDIESLTADRIKGRALLGTAKDQSFFSVGFDTLIVHGDAARMAAEGEALGKDGGQPGKDLIAALEAMRKRDYAALQKYASPGMREFLNDAQKREKSLAFLQSSAGDSQQIVNGLRKGDKASVYWMKKWRDPKVRNLRCTDSMILSTGTWQSSQSNCQAE